MENLVKTKEIGPESHCSENRAVANQINRKSSKKKRKCLMCDKLFTSEGPYNRRCSSCKRIVSLGGNRNFHDPSVYRFAYKEAAASVTSKPPTSLW